MKSFTTQGHYDVEIDLVQGGCVIEDGDHDFYESLEEYNDLKYAAINILEEQYPATKFDFNEVWKDLNEVIKKKYKTISFTSPLEIEIDDDDFQELDLETQMQIENIENLTISQERELIHKLGLTLNGNCFIAWYDAQIKELGGWVAHTYMTKDY